MFANGEILKDGKGNYYLYSSKKGFVNGSYSEDHGAYQIVTGRDYIYISSLKKDITPDMTALEVVVDLDDNVTLIPYKRRFRGFRPMKKSDNCFYYKDKLVNQFETYVVTPEKRIDVTGWWLAQEDSFVSNQSLENAVKSSELLYKDIPAYDFAIVECWGVVFNNDDGWSWTTAIQFIDKLDFRDVASRFWAIKGENNLACFFVSGNNNKGCSYCEDIRKCDNVEFLFTSIGSVNCNFGNLVNFSKDCRFSFGLDFCFDVAFSQSCKLCWKIEHASGFLFNKKREFKENEIWMDYLRGKIYNFGELYYALEYNKIQHLLRKPGATVTAKEVAEFRKYLLDEVL